MKKWIIALLYILILSILCFGAFADTTYGESIVRRYLDEFQEPTGEQYVSFNNYCTGTFSGAFATSTDINESAYLNILVDADDTALELFNYFTYSNYRVKNVSSNDYEYDIKVRYGPNEAIFFGRMYANGGDRVFILGRPGYNSVNEFDTILKENSIIRMLIEDKYSNREYLFSNINTNGFPSAYSTVLGEPLVVNISTDCYEAELNKPITVHYDILDGIPENRIIEYTVEVIHNRNNETINETVIQENLSDNSGTLTYTPTSGAFISFNFRVQDSGKVYNWTFQDIPMKGTRLTFPADTKRIESEAFSNIDRVVYVELPDSIEYIADDAFDGNENVIMFFTTNRVIDDYIASHNNCIGLYGNYDMNFSVPQ